MRALRIAAGYAICIVLSATVIGQGGQSGGFGGGGFGGGGFNSATGDEVTQNLILTPGDKGEWVVDAKAGETIVVSAKSSVFDPALEVVDQAGKVLTSNDDEEPGVQSPRLAYRFPTDGKYRVWVKGYKSAAGGPFELKMRRFMSTSIDAPENKPLRLDERGTLWLRVFGKKGQPFSLQLSIATGMPAYELIDPTGKQIGEEDFVSGQSRIDFRKVIDGDYYIKIHLRNASKALVEAIAKPISTFPVSVGKPNPARTLAARSIELAILEVNPGDFLRIESNSDSRSVWFAVETLESEQQPAFMSQVFDHRTKKNWATYLAKQKGSIVVAVRHSGDLPATYQLMVDSPLQTLKAGSETDSLKVGQIQYYRVDGKPGEIMRFQSGSSDFDVHLKLIDSTGAKIAEADDSINGTDAIITAALRSDGPYYLSVACYGMGGKGTYHLSKQSIAPIELVPGQSASKSITPADTQVWAIKAKKGQNAVLNIRSGLGGLDIQVIGPLGQTLQTPGRDGVLLLDFPEEGIYTVWIMAAGAGEYRIQLIDLNK